jgi:hypothetical protein
MAIKIYEPPKPLNEVVGGWMRQAEDELRANFQTQRIYPAEIYKGWLDENERRKAYAQLHPDKDVWYSTGEGYASIRAEVINASNPNNVTVGISHIAHMQFADMGVGIWGAYDDINRRKKARPNTRYISSWVPSLGETHRPGIMFKARTIQRRMENYLMNFYGLSLEARFLKATVITEKPFEIIG